MSSYQAQDSRYQTLPYRFCGRSGLKLPAVSLGLWHNFGGVDRYETSRALVRFAFDHGITHFDLANNYGPPPGSAESNFGEMLRTDLAPYRDELIISSKAGYEMGPGPYGDGGSRKYLVSSLDQSLKRMGLEYVDIFYHHRPDPETPLAETMGALDHIVRSGRALYVGISNYPAELAREASKLLRELGTPCVIHQPRYNMFDRVPEQGLLQTLDEEGIGCIAFSPLAQGLLSDRYLGGEVPGDSRAARAHFLKPTDITAQRLQTVRSLNGVALDRGQTLAQMALTWILRHRGLTSVLIGASRESQISDALKAAQATPLSTDELTRIDAILAQGG